VDCPWLLGPLFFTYEELTPHWQPCCVSVSKVSMGSLSRGEGLGYELYGDWRWQGRVRENFP
jgi:hypothetical protein